MLALGWVSGCLLSVSVKAVNSSSHDILRAIASVDLDIFMNYNLAWNDFIATRNWGKTKDGRFVLLDAGALDFASLLMGKTDDATKALVQKDWEKVLAGRKREGMGKLYYNDGTVREGFYKNDVYGTVGDILTMRASRGFLFCSFFLPDFRVGFYFVQFSL